MLTMKNRVKEENPLLRQVAKEVILPLSDEDKKHGKALLQFLKNSKNPILRKMFHLQPSAGIAAPQLGINKRIIAVHTKDENHRLCSQVLFNPQFTIYSTKQVYLPTGEQCLSIQRKIEGHVPRYACITVKGINLQGKEVRLHLKNYLAIVFQHEIDHLDGVLFYDYLNKNNLSSLKEAKPLHMA